MFYDRGMRVEYREEPCQTALNRVTGMPFRWSLNPYMGCAHRCAFCYVRHFEARADRPADARYGRSIRVKTNVAQVLRRELARLSWRREKVAIGAATDPYQPCEGRYRLTRACLQELLDARTPFGIITRGPMIRRDIDVLQDASRRASVTVSLSIPTLDQRVWRTTEPGTAPPRRRLEAVRALAEADVDVGVAIAPVLPGLSDAPEQLAAVVRTAREAGANSLWCAVVNLRPGAREHFLESLAEHWPEQLPLYEQLFDGRVYPPSRVASPLIAGVRALSAQHPPRTATRILPDPEPQQLALTV
jgi:DNA repair photolyase